MSLSGWDANKKIKCSVPAQASTLTDFPVLLNIGTSSGVTSRDNSEVFDDLGANSKKIAVEIGDTGVQCYVEIELWDDTGESAQLHVKIPSYLSTAATILNFYYDSTHADNTTYVGDTGDTPAQAVWDSNFIAVYHMAQDPSAGNVLDSTSNSRDMVPTGTFVTGDLIDGPVGKAIRFDVADYFKYADAGTTITDATLETMFRPDVGQVGSNRGLMTIGTADYNALSMCSGNDYGFYGGTTGSTNNIDIDYSPAPSAEVWQMFSGTTESSYTAVFLDGVLGGNTALGPALTNSDELKIGTHYAALSAWATAGDVAEARFSDVARSADWIAATNLSLTDTLITFSLPPGTSLLAFTDMPYGDLIAYHLAAVEQPYNILFPRSAFVDQYYSIKLGAAMAMHYGDSPPLQAVINQYYGNSPLLKKIFDMPYDQLLMLQHSIDMPYILPKALQQHSDMKYSLTGEHLQSIIEQPFDMLDRDILKRILNMPYMLMLDSILATVTVSATIDGEPVDPYHLNIEASIDHSDISCEIHLSSEAEFIGVRIGMEAEVTVNSDTYVFVVESKARKRSEIGNTVYQIMLASPVVLLESPWSDQITCSFDADTASNIIDLVAGQSVDTTEFVDFAVLSDTLFANAETPKDIIRKLKDTVGAMIQSNPDGSLRIIPEYPVAVNKWASATPDYFLTDARNFVSQDETFKHNTGYNIFDVSDQVTPEERIWTEVEGDDQYKKRVLGFHVPWSDTLEPTLEATKCGSANPTQYIGIVEEIYPPIDQDPEQVEFVAGFATASRPIYGNLAITCLSGHSLGAITTSEDGRLEAEYKDGVTDGYGLMAIRYLTKFHLWIVNDVHDESILYIMRADIEEDDEGGSCS